MTTLLQLPPQNIPFLNPNGTVARVWFDFLLTLVSRAGGITGGLQPADDTLTALSGLSGSLGLLVEAAPDTFTKRVLAGVADSIVITHPDGSDGNPTVDLAPVVGVAGTYAVPTSITVDAFGRITAIS